MLNLMQLKVGQKLQLRDGRLGEIVENFGDGIWVQLRFASENGQTDLGDDGELIHCEEIAGLAEKE
mgnify:FL=1